MAMTSNNMTPTSTPSSIKVVVLSSLLASPKKSTYLYVYVSTNIQASIHAGPYVATYKYTHMQIVMHAYNYTYIPIHTFVYIQWNLCIMGTLGPTKSVQIIKVPWSFYIIKCFLEPQLHKCVDYAGIIIFKCPHKQVSLYIFSYVRICLIADIHVDTHALMH